MRADRLISLILLLQHRGRMTCGDLARRLEVSRRTVLRDIDALSYAGIPLVTESGPGGGVMLGDDYRTSLTGLNDEEVRSLFLAHDGALLGDLGLGDAYRRSSLKLNASLSGAAQSVVEIARRRLLIDSRWWWHQEQSEETLGLLQEAVFGDAVVEFEYERYDGVSTRVRAEAYALTAKSGLWYFTGRRDGGFRCYRVSRISSPAATGERFARRPDFDIREWWPEHSREFAGEFSSYRCVLSVPEADLRLVYRMAPGRTKILRRGEKIEAELGLESEWYAMMMVFGLGPGCTILEPESLKESVARRAGEILEP